MPEHNVSRYFGPVTALSSSDSRVIVGSGSLVYSYNLRTNEVEVINTIEKGCVVHGIRNDGQVAFGGRSFSIVGHDPFFLNEAVLDACLLRPELILLVLSSGRLVVVDAKGRCLSELRTPPKSRSRQLISARIANNCQSEDTVLVAGGSVLGSLQVWSSTQVYPLEGHNGAVFTLCFSDDNRLLCTGGEDRSVRLWERSEDTAQFKALWRNYSSEGRVWDCSFYSNGIASIAEDSILRLFDVQGNNIASIDAGKNLRCICQFNDIIFAAGAAGYIHAFDSVGTKTLIEPMRNLAINEGSQGVVTAFTVSDNNACIALTGDWHLLIYDFNEHGRLDITMSLDALCSPKRNEIAKSILVLESNLITLGTSVGRLIVIDIMDAAVKFVAKEHAREVSVLARNGSLLVSGSGDGILCTWKIGKNLLHSCKLPTSKSSPTCAIGLMDQGLFAVGDSFGNVFVYDGASNVFTRKFYKCHGLMPVTMIKTWGTGFVSSGRNGRIAICGDGNNITNELSCFGPMTQVEGFDFQDEKNSLVIGTVGDVWLVYSYTRQVVVKQIRGSVKAPIAFKANFGLLSAGVSCVMHASLEQTRQVLMTQWNNRAGHSRIIWSVTWLDNNTFVTASEDGTLRVWNTERCIKVLDAPKSAMRCVHTTISKSDTSQRVILSTGAAGLLQAWQWDGNEATFLAEHRPLSDETRLLAICESNFDSSVLFAAGSDGFIYKYALRRSQDSANTQTEDCAADEENVGVTTSSTKAKRKLPAGLKLRPVLHTKCDLDSICRFGKGERVILRLCCIRVNEKREFLLAGQTNGTLLIFEVTNMILVHEILLHDGGLIALACQMNKFGHMMVATGGDDQAVCLIIFRITSDDDNLAIQTRLKIENVAATAVTGVDFCGEQNIMACSADQRLTRVQIKGDSLVMLDQQMLEVGDVTDMSINEDQNKVVIVGVGLQILHLDQNPIY